MTRHSRLIAGLGAVLALGGNAPALAAPAAPAHWLTSWYAAPQAAWDDGFLLPMNVPAALDDQTVRDTVRLSAGGKRIRLVLSNRYGRAPVRVGKVEVGLEGDAGAARLLTFSGQAAISIPPGAGVTSDPVALAVPPLGHLRVTSYFPTRTPIAGFHWGAQQTFAVETGDTAGLARAATATRAGGRLFLSAIMVEAGADARTVVALGDSITDGNGSTPDADRRWPDFLAQRLTQAGAADVGVANAGISGARLLRDGMGQNALARFDQDVLAQPGVSDGIVLLGINDIGWPGSPFAPAEPAAGFEALCAGYRQLAAAAHARGVRITVGTLPPFEGALEGTPYAGHYSVQKEGLRTRLNAWIRAEAGFDAVVDFDAVLRDPAHPRRLRADYDSGDHLHPGDAGYRAMAAAIDIAPLLRAASPIATSRAAAP